MSWIHPTTIGVYRVFRWVVHSPFICLNRAILTCLGICGLKIMVYLTCKSHCKSMLCGDITILIGIQLSLITSAGNVISLIFRRSQVAITAVHTLIHTTIRVLHLQHPVKSDFNFVENVRKSVIIPIMPQIRVTFIRSKQNICRIRRIPHILVVITGIMPATTNIYLNSVQSGVICMTDSVPSRDFNTAPLHLEEQHRILIQTINHGVRTNRERI